jgi:hypothetical protein
MIEGEVVKIMLRWMSEKDSVKVWAGFISFRIGSDGRLLLT